MELMFEKSGAIAHIWIDRMETLNALNRKIVNDLDRMCDKMGLLTK